MGGGRRDRRFVTADGCGSTSPDRVREQVRRSRRTDGDPARRLVHGDGHGLWQQGQPRHLHAHDASPVRGSRDSNRRHRKQVVLDRHPVELRALPVAEPGAALRHREHALCDAGHDCVSGMAGPARLCRGRPDPLERRAVPGREEAVARRSGARLEPRPLRGWRGDRQHRGQRVSMHGKRRRRRAACRLGPLSAGHWRRHRRGSRQPSIRVAICRPVRRVRRNAAIREEEDRPGQQSGLVPGRPGPMAIPVSRLCAREGRREFRRLEVQGDGPGRAEGDRARPLRRDRGFRLRPCTPSAAARPHARLLETDGGVAMGESPASDVRALERE